MNDNFLGIAILAGVGAMLIGGATLASVEVVDEGERGIVLHWGEYSETLEPGLHFVNPFSNDVQRYSTRITKTSFDNLTAYSHDQQIIEKYTITVSWSYNADKIGEIYKNYGNTLVDSILTPAIQQDTKAILGQYTAQTIIQDRNKLQNEISTTLKTDLESYPIKIYEVKLEDINFSKSYEAIIEQTAAKKLEIDKARNELQRVELESQQKVKQAESENKALKLKAEAEAYKLETDSKAKAESLKIVAEAEAYAIELKSKAEAQALELKGKALQTNPHLVDMTIAEKWKGNVPNVSLGKDSIPLLQLGNLK